jgi:DHA2 family multidrug resistance protein-like MFS transporter
VFLQLGMGFTPFHAGLMMIPMVLGSMGMKRVVVRLVNQLGYRKALVSATLLLALITLIFPLVAIYGAVWMIPIVLFFQGMVNSLRFSSMNTLTLKDLPPRLASSGNSLLSMIMQLSMSLGVSVAGLLIGLFAHQQAITPDSATMHTAFLYCYMSMALVIALPAWVFSKVPPDTQKNAIIDRRRAAAGSPDPMRKS